MMRFYGLGFEELMSMEPSLFEELSQAMPVLQARELLMQMKAADYPNYKKADRKEVHREIYKTGHPSFEDDKKIGEMTTLDLAKMLGGIK